MTLFLLKCCLEGSLLMVLPRLQCKGWKLRTNIFLSFSKHTKRQSPVVSPVQNHSLRWNFYKYLIKAFFINQFIQMSRRGSSLSGNVIPYSFNIKRTKTRTNPILQYYKTVPWPDFIIISFLIYGSIVQYFCVKRMVTGVKFGQMSWNNFLTPFYSFMSCRFLL